MEVIKKGIDLIAFDRTDEENLINFQLVRPSSAPANFGWRKQGRDG